MEEDKFYILIEDRYYRHEHDTDDFHIEKVFSKEDVLEFIQNCTRSSRFDQTQVFVTNDKNLLSTHLVTINEDEFKMLCRLDNYDKKNIRINSAYFNLYNEQVYEYYKKIKADEIISASMDFRSETFYPYDHDPTIGISSKSLNGWVENKEFSFFKTPHRYLNEEQSNKQFYLDDIKKANLETLKRLININILEIGKDDNDPSINWELRKGMLRYYDKISCKRLYISQEHLNALSKNNDLVFTIDTQLDTNHYIEFYVTGIENGEEQETDFESQRNYDDTYAPKYDKYNGAYGLDDHTIDSAFEGDPENYWNID